METMFRRFNKTQVNIFLMINHNTRKSQVLEKCTNNMYSWVVFLKYLLVKFLKGAGQWSIQAWSIYVAEEKPPALAMTYTGNRTDIVLEVKKLNIIPSGGQKVFLKKQLLGYLVL